MRMRVQTALILGVLAATEAIGSIACADTPTTRSADPRWRDLPHTNYTYTPDLPTTLDAWQVRRRSLREQILFAAGLWPMPPKGPLRPERFGRLERDGYTVEKVYFESYPGFYVTGNLYRPGTIKPGRKVPAIACPHGHWPKGRLNEEARGSVPARCISLARLGCVVFAYDMVGYNDSGRQIDPHRHAATPREELWGVNMLGLQLWNSIRVIDFLESLPEVDQQRIACTGASGGGTQTFLLGAVDNRVSVSAPVNMISSIMQGGCVCENAPCLRIDTDNMEIGAMMAPRPMIMVSATGDWTKNTPKVEYPAIRGIYRLYGAEDKVASVQIDAEHNYNKASREAVYVWFAKWLKLRDAKDESPIQEPAYPVEKDEDLLVFADRALPAGAVDLEALIEQRIAAARAMIESRRPKDEASLSAFRREGAKAFRLLGTCPELPSRIEVRVVQPRGRDLGRPVEEYYIDPGRGTSVPVLGWHSQTTEGHRNAWAIVVHPRGSAGLFEADGTTPVAFVTALLAAENHVLSVDAFGTGRNVGQPDPEHPRGSTDFFTTFNRTDAVERALDVRTAIQHTLQMHAQTPKGARGPVRVIGIGEAGPWCLLAAAMLDRQEAPGVRLCLVIDANRFDTSSDEAYVKQLQAPHLLRIGGLPVAAALVLPVDLLLHNVGEKFDASWVRDVAKLTPTARVRIEKDKLNDAQIKEWLAGK